MGHYPQSKGAIYHCDVWSEPNFIEHAHFTKIDFDPIIANAVLHPSSKLTDLISITGIGFTKKLLVSGRLKSILESKRSSGVQFFRDPVSYKGNLIDDYWILNIYEIDMNLVDIKNSEVLHRKRKEEGGTFLVKVDFDRIDEFLKMIEINNLEGDLFLNRFKIRDESNEDFFVLLNVWGGAKYIVSEKLKEEIEKNGCTGIEFMPTELSQIEWLQGGEREKVYGKV